VVGPHVPSLRRQLRSLRRARNYVTAPARHGAPVQRGPLISEPGPVDFTQYGMVARIWMEQVRGNIDLLRSVSLRCFIHR